MNEQIEKTLIKYFEKNRIVFWYDDKKGDESFRAVFDQLEIPDVKKILLDNNEFNVKYRILRQEYKQKFLIYHEGKKPDDLNNWLLDVLEANVEFKSEQYVLRLAELGLGPEMSEITKKYPEFYKDKTRSEKLKKIVNQSEDTVNVIKDKMLAICTKAENHNIDSVLKCLLKEYANGKEDAINLIKYCKLDEYLYKSLHNNFAYHSPEPSIKDFIIKLFNYAFKVDLKLTLRDDEKLNLDAIVFLKEWKDSRQYTESFEKISAEVADILGVKELISKYDYKDLLDCDYFSMIDDMIIENLTQDIYRRSISKEECLNIIFKRKNKRWTDEEMKTVYLALENAIQFMSMFTENESFCVNDISDGINKYITSWYKIDQYYRKYVCYTKQIKQKTTFAKLSEEIENLYSNKYLLTVNDNWQQHIDKLENWEFSNIENQREFFIQNVMPFVNKKQKLFVIVSDALRYEIGNEIANKLQIENNKFNTKLHAAISSAPSYTQLGMAALLPNKDLKVKINENTDSKNSTVYVDDVSSAGIDNRIKILKNCENINAIAFDADDIINASISELQNMIENCDIAYIYHDEIDLAGHTAKTEQRVFKDTESAIEELILLINKLAKVKVKNILLTADHGFIYQNKPLDESDYLGETPQGTILYSDRRFIIGRDLQNSNSFKKFTATQLGLNDDYEYLFPKSINRLRKKASTSQYVHGGLSLQELIIPIVQIAEVRKNSIDKVDVDFDESDKMCNANIISSNILTIKLKQINAKSENIGARTLRICVYNAKGERLSEFKTETFASESDNALEKIRNVELMLITKIDEENGNVVTLKLEEQEPNTTHFKLYASKDYMVRKMFEKDDFN